MQVSEPSGKAARARFGTTLTAGDLDGDGFPDLAVGAPAQPVSLAGGGTARGTVTVLRGGTEGKGLVVHAAGLSTRAAGAPAKPP